MYGARGSRNSLKYVSYKHRKAVATDLKAIYGAATEAEAEFNLELFAEKWDPQYPTISKSWRAQWARVIPLFAFPADIRKVIYTTNAIESVNMTLRKVTRNHRTFPSDEAVYKVLAPFDAEHRQEMDHASSRLEPGVKPLCDRICGTVPAMSFQPIYTLYLTDSAHT